MVIANPPVPLSAADDLVASEAALTAIIAAELADHRPSVVVAPSPVDAHHAHEAVSRATLAAIERVGRPLAVWLWGLWADLPAPTLVIDFEPVLERALFALDAHTGENARNDYADLLGARARANAVLGAERVFGFGAARLPFAFADLLQERVYTRRAWVPGHRRVLDPGQPLSAEDVIAARA